MLGAWGYGATLYWKKISTRTNTDYTENFRKVYKNRIVLVFMGGKRGISAVVATVLVILITVAGVAIIWVGILPMIKESFVFSELDGRVSVVSTGGYTLYDADREVAIVQVRREPDEGVMDRVKVSFVIDGNSVSSSVVAPDSGGVKTYAFDLY